MTAPDTLPAADRRRAATILLACLDDDGADVITATLDEAYASPEGLQGLIAPLALATLDVLIQRAGEDRARELLTEYLCHAPSADHRRAAVLLSAAVDDDVDTFNTALAEACAASLPGLLAALAQCGLSVLVVAIGVEDARATLNLLILNAEVDCSD